MERNYDFIYLTNSPSFYKLNLFNEIGKSVKVLFVFYGYDNQAVNRNLRKDGDWKFDYVFLYEGDTDKRSVF